MLEVLHSLPWWSESIFFIVYSSIGLTVLTLTLRCDKVEEK
ncbi:hypothetical protein [Desulfuribacillus alkaliarsenatis]|nr:hypothetical protein [Desulfuribacillus alkaliarsenatis]